MISIQKIYKPFSYSITLSVVFLLWTILLTNCTPNEFKGTTITNGQEIPSFKLTDQYNNSVITDDFDGQIIVLTFLYSECKEECKIIVPIISKLQSEILNQHPDIAKDITFLSISVDPNNDIPENTYKYMRLNNENPYWQSKEVQANWVFLSGELEKLEDIWSHYGIATDAAIMDQGNVIEVISQKTMQDLYNKDSFPSYRIDHSLPIYIIDKSGVTRSVYNDLKIDTEDIIHDILLIAN